MRRSSVKSEHRFQIGSVRCCGSGQVYEVKMRTDVGCSLHTINLWVWEGGNAVEEEGSISSDQEDRQSLEEVSNGDTLLLPSLPGQS